GQHAQSAGAAADLTARFDFRAILDDDVAGRSEDQLRTCECRAVVVDDDVGGPDIDLDIDRALMAYAAEQQALGAKAIQAIAIQHQVVLILAHVGIRSGHQDLLTLDVCEAAAPALRRPREQRSVEVDPLTGIEHDAAAVERDAWNLADG